eukprot:CAMPEP_0174841972 /NCGR_PEP_ID=MMETSP1114-20130205/9637_1 /TAXON_ID=312471 /ORGANISM="Neobodo designis, Strain CCAP 1951/1" /LENGTH=324 /DNA_ID=CAMNT_0016076169 /DNA_START=31 /DNA_END=1002 /DNA_ORIENTATION=+
MSAPTTVVLDVNAFPRDMLALLALSKRPEAVKIAAVVLTPVGAWADIAIDLVAKVMAFAWQSRMAEAPPLFIVDVPRDTPQRERAESLEIMQRKHSLDLQCFAGLCTPEVLGHAMEVSARATSGLAIGVASAVAKVTSEHPRTTLLVASGCCSFAATLLETYPTAVGSVVVCGGVAEADATKHGLKHADKTSSFHACPGFHADPEAAATALARAHAVPVTLWPSAATNACAVSEEDIRRLAAQVTPQSAPWPSAHAQLEAALWTSYTPLNHAVFGGAGGGIGPLAAALSLAGVDVAADTAEKSVAVDTARGHITESPAASDSSR